MENISMATKAEIQEEMKSLESEFSKRKENLANRMVEWKKEVEAEAKKSQEIMSKYSELKKELDRREGKSITHEQREEHTA